MPRQVRSLLCYWVARGGAIAIQNKYRIENKLYFTKKAAKNKTGCHRVGIGQKSRNIPLLTSILPWNLSPNFLLNNATTG